MYMNYYRLRGEPFGITPDPRFLFLSAAHREALAALVYGVSQRKGFISVIGEVGTGKTIVLRAFLEGIDRRQTTAISLLNPLATFDQIIQEILPPEFKGSGKDRYRTLQEWLIEEYRQGRNVVVAIDEAQCMSPVTLERLRLLSNLETADHKLIQVVLAGQPELERKLEQPNLRQLRERIAVRAKIWPLNPADSVAYIVHRLSKVRPAGSPPLFTRAAIRYLARRAKGNPRQLNILCDAALLTGFSYQKNPVPWVVTWEACNGTTRWPRWRHAMSVRASALFALAIAATGLAGFLADWSPSQPTVTESRGGAQSYRDGRAGGERVAPTLLSRVPASETSRAGDPAPAMTHGADTPATLDQAVAVEAGEDTVGALAIDRFSGGVDAKAGLKLFGEKVMVRQGNGLWQLCREVYGKADADLVRLVVQANPHIRDPDNLEVGVEIEFPALPDLQASASAREFD